MSNSVRRATPSATQTALRTSLGAALLPMCLALPATGVSVATAAPAAAATSAIGLVGPTTAVRPGAHAFRVHVVSGGRNVPGAPVRFEVLRGSRWANAGSVRTNATGSAIGALSLGSTTRVRAVTGRAVSRTLTVAITRPAASRARAAAAPTAVGLVGPTTAVRPGAHAFRVHVVSGGRNVAGIPVRFEVLRGGRWASAGTVRTNATGTAIGALSLGSTTRVRAVAGRAVSRPATVTITRPAASRTRAAAPAAPAAVSAAGGFRAAAVRVALAQRGKPYRWGSTGPSSFDCSGLVNFAFRSVGKTVPRTSSQLRAWTRPVSRSAAVPGDLVFSPGHVGIWLSPGMMIDSPNGGGVVSVRRIYASNYTIGRVA